MNRFGIWHGWRTLNPEIALQIEQLGFGCLWVGGSPPADLAAIEALLDATTTLSVATGIVNIWESPAAEVARSFHRLEAARPGRFTLGIGAGHPEASGEIYQRPYEALVSYLDILDAEGVPADRRALAALGPKVLKLAADRCAGAHPYLTTPEHTRSARAILGADRLLVPEQRVVLDANPVRARAVGRPTVHKPYLGLVNYRNSWLRLGFSEDDLAGAGSDKLIDALVVYGDDETVAARLHEHLDAGADQVAIQLLASDDVTLAHGYERLAAVLL